MTSRATGPNHQCPEQRVLHQAKSGNENPCTPKLKNAQSGTAGMPRTASTVGAGLFGPRSESRMAPLSCDSVTASRSEGVR